MRDGGSDVGLLEEELGRLVLQVEMGKLWPASGGARGSRRRVGRGGEMGSGSAEAELR